MDRTACNKASRIFFQWFLLKSRTSFHVTCFQATHDDCIQYGRCLSFLGAVNTADLSEGVRQIAYFLKILHEPSTPKKFSLVAMVKTVVLPVLSNIHQRAAKDFSGCGE